MIPTFAADVDILGSSSSCWRRTLDVGSGMFLFWGGLLHEDWDLL